MKRRAWAAWIVLAAANCSAAQLPRSAPVLENVLALREADIRHLSVGTFALAQGSRAEIDRAVSARANPISAQCGSFARHLRTTLIDDLRAVDRYDPASALRIEGELVGNTLNAAGLTEARASLSVRFRMFRGKALLFEKVLTQDASWDSTFIGAVAVPDAVNHFGEQFQRILQKLYLDPDFLKAARQADDA